MHDKSYDVVVVGAGMAGLAAGLSALTHGAKTAILDKGNTVGGTSFVSGGTFWVLKKIEPSTMPFSEEACYLEKAVIANYDRCKTWLETQGVKFGPYQARIYVHGGHGFSFDPDPVTVLELLHNRFTELGGTIMTSTTAYLLEDTGDEGTYTLAVRGPGEARLAARVVVLCTGGFAANQELVSQFIGSDNCYPFTRASSFNTGDGLIMAKGLGAQTAGCFGDFYGHLLPVSPPARLGPPEWRSLAMYFSRQAILVNMRGERFVDESASDEANASALARQPGGTGLLIFDDLIEEYEKANETQTSTGFTPVDRVERTIKAGGLVIKANSLDEFFHKAENIVENAVFEPKYSSIEDMMRVAGHWRIPSEQLRRTILSYNEWAERGVPSMPAIPRGKLRHPLRGKIIYGLPVMPGISVTYGGLAVNTANQVLDRAGRPIPGLFAAGADVGGVFRQVYGGGLAMAAVSGLLAGEGSVRHLSEVMQKGD